MVLKEVRVLWANVQDVNPMSDKFQVEVQGLTEEQVAEFEQHGINVGFKEDKGNFVVFKSLKKPKVVDKNKQEISDLVGNGSLCNIAWNPYPWEFKKKKGFSAGLKALQVLELVEYNGPGGGVDEFDAEEDDVPF